MKTGQTQNSETRTPLALTRGEAAKLLSISTVTLDRLCKRGLLRPSRALRKPLFTLDELKRFLAETATGGLR